MIRVFLLVGMLLVGAFGLCLPVHAQQMEFQSATDTAMTMVIIKGVYQLATVTILGVCAIICCMIIGRAIVASRRG